MCLLTIVTCIIIYDHHVKIYEFRRVFVRSGNFVLSVGVISIKAKKDSHS